MLTPLQSVTSEQKKGGFTLDDKLTQLLLSFLTWADSRFASWGLKRLVRDLLAIPGRVYFEGRQLKRIELLASHQYADELIICLERYCSGHFGNRNGLCLHELCQP